MMRPGVTATVFALGGVVLSLCAFDHDRYAEAGYSVGGQTLMVGQRQLSRRMACGSN